MEWKKEGEMSAHAFLNNCARARDIVDQFVEMTGGRYKPVSAHVAQNGVGFELQHELANAKHSLNVSFRKTPSGRDAYTFDFLVNDHFGFSQGWMSPVNGTLDKCLSRTAKWQEDRANRVEKYWRQYQHAAASLKEAGFEQEDDNVFLAKGCTYLLVEVTGLVSIVRPAHRNVEDIIAAIRPR